MDLSQFEAGYTPVDLGYATGKKKTKKGSGNQSFASSLISEAGGAGGALGGAAIGTMIMPGVGTLIGAGLGGFLGGTGGRAAENKVRDNEYRLGDALEEGAISGVMGAGPGQLAKGLTKGAGALKGSARTLESALVDGSKEPLKTSVRGRLQSAGDDLIASQYGTIPAQVARQVDPRETIKTLSNAGVLKPKDAERIANSFTGSEGIVNKAVLKAVGGAGAVDTANLPAVVQKAVTENFLKDKDGKALADGINAIVRQVDPKKPESVLQVMKQLEAQSAEFLGRGGTRHLPTSADKNRAKAIAQVRSELEESLYKGAGANANLATVLTPELRNELVALHPKNPQWQKYIDDSVMKAQDVGQLRSSMAPFVRVKRMIDEGDMNSFTFGGRMGNLANAAQGGGLGGLLLTKGAEVMKNPAARMTGQALHGAANFGTGDITTTSAGGMAKGIAGRIGLIGGAEAAGATYGAMRSGAPAFAAGMRGGEQQDLEGAMSMPQSGMPQGDMQDMDGMGMQEQSANPYSKENLLMDIQRDPQNANEYMKQYAVLEEIYGAQGGQDYDAATVKSLNQSANGENTLGQLEDLFSATGSGSGRIGGTLQNFAGRAGLNNNAAAYNSLADGSVAQIAKALGETGTLSDSDKETYAMLLPRVTDTPEVARIKFEALRNRLMTARQNTLRYGAGMEDPQLMQGAM